MLRYTPTVTLAALAMAPGTMVGRTTTNGAVWSAQERKTIATLTLSNLGATPHDAKVGR